MCWTLLTRVWMVFSWPPSSGCLYRWLMSLTTWTKEQQSFQNVFLRMPRGHSIQCHKAWQVRLEWTKETSAHSNTVRMLPTTMLNALLVKPGFEAPTNSSSSLGQRVPLFANTALCITSLRYHQPQGRRYCIWPMRLPRCVATQASAKRLVATRCNILSLVNPYFTRTKLIYKRQLKPTLIYRDLGIAHCASTQQGQRKESPL